MSKRSRKPKEERTFPEDLFGLVWARRLRIGIPIVGLVCLLAGSTAYVLWSQTLGGLLLVPGIFLGAGWLLFRKGFDEDPFEWVRRKRWWLVVSGLGAAAAGWVLFFTVNGDLGLLVVVFGAAPICAAGLGVRYDHSGGFMDGPPYGETNG